MSVDINRRLTILAIRFFLSYIRLFISNRIISIGTPILPTRVPVLGGWSDRFTHILCRVSVAWRFPAGMYWIY